MANVPIKRIGGKSKMAKWIVSLLPNHEIYCETFGGSYAVGLELLKKRRIGNNYKFVYNDLDGHTCNIFRVIRDYPEEFAKKVDATPYSREEFEYACKVIESEAYKNLNPVEWARLYLIYNRQSFSGKEDCTWCIARDGENISATWDTLPAMLLDVSKKMKKAFIECSDYVEVLRRWDSPKTLFYMDPPYEDVEKDYYHVNEEDGFDHEKMAEHVFALEGSVAISYYDSPSIREMYEKNGFKVYSKDVLKHMQTLKKKEKATEILLVRESSWSQKKKSADISFED